MLRQGPQNLFSPLCLQEHVELLLIDLSSIGPDDLPAVDHIIHTAARQAKPEQRLHLSLNDDAQGCAELGCVPAPLGARQ